MEVHEDEFVLPFNFRSLPLTTKITWTMQKLGNRVETQVYLQGEKALESTQSAGQAPGGPSVVECTGASFP